MTAIIVITVGVTCLALCFALSTAYGCAVHVTRTQIGWYTYGNSLLVKYLSESEPWTRATYVGLDLEGRILTQRKGEDQIRRIITHKPYHPFCIYEGEEIRRN